MKTESLPSTVCLAMCLLLNLFIHPSPAKAQTDNATNPKRILVVSTTMGFRHSSIPTAEKVLGDLAARTGEFTVEYARVDTGGPRFKGEDGKPDPVKVKAAIKLILAKRMSPEAMKHYDAVVFANTTGDLPMPDPDAFLEWIKSGKGFIGMHSATDTFPGFPAYTEMIGGHFKGHGPQVEVDIINQDPECGACRNLPASWTVFDEIYLLRDFDRSKVQGLLTLDRHPNDKTPGDYPIAWRRDYGDGRVFYTSLGHREDLWDPDWKDNKGQRKNTPEVSRQYQDHILGGIRWALGMDVTAPE